MLAENLKNLLGEELSKQVEEAVKAKGKDGKDLDIVVGNDGSYVPAEKYDTEKQKSIKSEEVVKQITTALKGLGGSGDSENIMEDIKTAQQSIEDLKNNHKKELEELSKHSALKMALTNKAHDAEDIISMLDMDTIKVDNNGNLINSIDDLIKPIKEKKSYLFKEEKGDPLDVKGIKPGGSDGGQEQKTNETPSVTAL